MASKRAVALISKPGKKELAELIPTLVRELEKRGFAVLMDPETTAYLSSGKAVERSRMAEHLPVLAIVLGGDGTLLAAARVLAKANVPLLAVNLGSLGFLTEVPKAELMQTLDAYERNECSRESRTMLDVRLLRGGETLAEYAALNDVVITKSTIARMTEVDLRVNGEFVANYKADGVIISTPTGSTAYSLAAGGPVLEPGVEAFVVTPVSPHGLTNRPLVLKDSVEIRATVRATAEEAFLTVDGQVGTPLVENDEVVCCKSKHRVQLLRLPGRTFFDVLRTKLKWGER